MIGWALGLRKARRKQRKFGPALCEKGSLREPKRTKGLNKDTWGLPKPGESLGRAERSQPRYG